MKHRELALALFAITWTALAAPPAADAAPTAGAVEEVLAVEVPVRVFRDGEPVSDLSAEDFVLYDRGNRQEITGFERLDLRRAGTATSGETAPPPQLRRRLFLLFDLAYSRPASIERAQRVAVDLVRNRLRPSDLVAVGVYTVDRGVEVILGFSPDRDQAEVAVRTLGLAGLVETADDPLGFAIGSFDGERQAELASHLTEASRFITQAERNRRLDLVLAFAGAMERLGGVLREVPGQKDVLLFSEGWDASLLTGTDDREQVEGLARAVETGEYWKVDSQNRFGDSTSLRELEEGLDELRRVGVAIQAVDLGTGVIDPADGSRSSAADSLYTVSSATGGAVFRTGANDASGLEPLLERTAVTYLLTFQPRRAGDPGEFRHLRVELTDGAGEATVLHRSGYFVPRPFSELSLQERRIGAANRLIAGREGGALGLAPLAVPVGQPQGPPWVALLVEIDGPALLEGAVGEAIELELFGYAFDAEGSVADHFAERWGLALDQIGDTLRSSGVKYFGHLDLPPGEYRLHLLARDGAGREGLRVVPLHVPDLAPGERADSTPLVPDPPGRWVMIRESAERQAVRSVDYPFVRDGRAFVPAVTPSENDRVSSTSPVLSAPAPSASAATEPVRPLILVPPRERQARGRTRIETVISDPAVARVDFSLDDEPIASDQRPPFRATVDLGDGTRAVEVHAAAYALDGRYLGEDRVVLHRETTPFDVTITRFDRRPDEIEVDVQVSVPPDRRLDRVEIYRGDELVATSGSDQVQTRLPVPSETGAPGDFVRVVARLADGEFREEVRLIEGSGRGERLEVRLVQLFVVVTDEAGRPVEDLASGDFRLHRGDRSLPIERVISAGEVPLTLGVLLDSSKSMRESMLQAKLATASFLREVLAPDDRAFLVDFDVRPRLAVDATGDTAALERALDSFDAGGTTALFDSLVFALGRLGAEEGRRALVLLSDGEDEGSRFRAERVVELARAEAIPVYALALERPGAQNDRLLDRLATETGGRSLAASTPDEVRSAFATIERELRTQYVVLHAPGAPLDAEALAELEVEVVEIGGRSLRVRTLPLR